MYFEKSEHIFRLMFVPSKQVEMFVNLQVPMDEVPKELVMFLMKICHF